MNIRSLCLSWPFLFSSAFVQASDYAKHGSYAIWSLRQLSDLSGDQLPQDILNVLSQSLIELERYGVLLSKEAGKRWIPLEKIVRDMTAFRDSEPSETDIVAILANKEQIKKGLLLLVSAGWQNNLEDLIGKVKREGEETWQGRAYGAAFLAYHEVEHLGRSGAARSVAGYATGTLSFHDTLSDDLLSAWDPDWNDAWRYSWEDTASIGNGAGMSAFTEAALPLKQKLKVLAAKPVGEIGRISYDLAEIFTLLWLIKNAHAYHKMAFDVAYERFPEMDLDEIKGFIEAALKVVSEKSEHKGDMRMEALQRELDALEKFILAK